MVISGSAVNVVNLADGTSKPYLQFAPSVENLNYAAEANLFAADVKEAAVPTLTLFDGTSGECILTARKAETVAYADNRTFILTMGERVKLENGYTFSSIWIEGFDRKSARKIWSLPYQEVHDPWHEVARVRNYFVIRDGTDFEVVDSEKGLISRQAAPKPANSMGPSGIRNEDGMLVYVATEMNMHDFNHSKHTVYRLSVPDLKVLGTQVVELIEVADTEAAGEFLISDALYRTACFRRDGTKVWEHFQMHRTKVIDGVIYFSDNDQQGSARVGSIVVASGKETILASEKIAVGEP